MRRRLCVPIFLAVLAASGCASNQTKQASSPAAQPAAASAFKVALLTTGPVTDGGWNQSAYEGLQLIQKDLGAQIDKQESLQPAQFREAFQDFASKGYNIVFAHGDEFGKDAEAVSKQFPKTVFITTGGDETPGPNVAPIRFATEQGTYLQGMEAAMVSKTGKGGFVGGQELPPVKIAADAFAQGAQSVNPNYHFKITYINSWSDTVAAKAQTEALLANGADTIAHNCDAAAKGMFDTAGKAPGVYTFGVNADENGKAPNVLSSVFLDVPKAFEDIAKSVKDGTFKGQVLSLGLKDNDVRLIDNPKLANVIPAAGKARIQQAAKDIESGKIVVTHT